MSEPIELWTFVLSNLLVLVLGGSLTVLSYRAYRRLDRRPLRNAALGFAVVTVGTLVEAVYEFGVRGTYELTGRELLMIHSVEGVLIAAGLATLFYSLVGY